MKVILSFKSVSPENYRKLCRLSVNESQMRSVSSAVGILARAYAFRECVRVFALYDDNTPIGLILLRDGYLDSPDYDAYNINQFFIDKGYQARGYGTRAMLMLLEMLREERHFNRVALCYVDGSEGAARLYTKLGFMPTGESDGDEITMVLPL